ncbi:MAG: chromate transporter [Clostridiales bacterium]|nr:chromate transporter [Clostridiales bacterium]
MKKTNKSQQNTGEIQTVSKRVSLWALFITFFKTGLFTFGGGYAMIAILEEELVSKRGWITSQDMLDMLVIAESTPGVIAVNTATSVGFRVRGVLGAIVATLGVVLPSFVIITALSFFIAAFEGNRWYQAAFTGIQACVTVLVVNAFVKMAKQVQWGWFSAIIMPAAFAVALFTNFDVIFIILIGGALGIIYTFIADYISKKKQLPLEQSERLDEPEEVVDKTEHVDADGNEVINNDGGDEQ